MSVRRTIATALLALCVLAPASPASADCMSRAQGRNLMEQGQIVPLPEALQRAGLESGQVVDAQLCQAGGGFVYKVRVLQNGGKVRAVNIPAN